MSISGVALMRSRQNLRRPQVRVESCGNANTGLGRSSSIQYLPPPAPPPVQQTNSSRPANYDDDIQEVVSVKSEPREATTPSTALATTTNQNDQDSSLVETGQGQVALEESYQDESYDYGNGMFDPNTVIADGNKGKEKPLFEKTFVLLNEKFFT